MQKKFSYISIILVFLIFSILFFAQINKPLTGDEIFFHAAADYWFRFKPHINLLYHTPLYTEALVLWQKIFGYADPNHSKSLLILRSFNFFSVFITCIIFIFGFYKINKKIISFLWIFLSLFLFHPYFLQSSYLLDIDYTIQTPLLLLTIILLELWDKDKNPKLFLPILISFITAVNLMAKEITPFLILFLIPIWSALRSYRKKENSKIHFTQSFLIIIFTLIFFTLMLFIWSKLRGINFFEPLKPSFLKFKALFSNNNHDPNLLLKIKKFIFLNYLPILWLGFPTLILIIRPIKNLKSIYEIPLGFWFSLLTFCFYSIITQKAYYFAKYTSPTLPILIFSYSQLMNNDKTFDYNFMFSNLNSVKQYFYSIFFFLFIIGLVPILNPLFIIPWRNELDLSRIFAHLVGVILPSFCIYLLTRKSMLVASLGLIIYLLTSSIQNLQFNNFSLNYNFGETGYSETIKFVNKLKQKFNLVSISTASDLQWNLEKNLDVLSDEIFQKEAKVENLNINYRIPSNNDTLNLLKSSNIIVVTRTYDYYSIKKYPNWYEFFNKNYKCHLSLGASISNGSPNFEVWWNSNKEKCLQ